MERFAGRYVLLRELGSGGMGEVFLARDLTTGGTCALKRLTHRTAPAARAALAQEFDLVARVRHPAVVAVHELGFTREGVPFYTMEYVPGLAAHLAVRRGDWATLCFVAARVAHGLESLHAAGVVHGDLKPSNLLVVSGANPDDLPAEVRLLDFGLAGLLAGERKGHRGTPGYAAPEVVRGEGVNEAADLYGLGATLYALIAGTSPFTGESPAALLRRQQAGPPPGLPLEEAGAPPALVRLVLRLLAPSPGDRPRDARTVRRELESVHPAARWPLAERVNVATPVGRDRELARLDVSTGARRDRVVLVTGDAGFGKSLLLETVALRATLAGAWVARLSCAALEGPGAVARALLLRLAADAPETGDERLAELRARIERSDSATLEDTGELVAAGIAWAEAIGAKGRPRVVLLDDTERLDALSGMALRRLALHERHPITLWVWARRETGEEPIEDDRALFEAGHAEHMPLGRLTRDGVAALASARLQSPAPAALVEFLVARADGHPGLTVELLRAAAAAGAIVESESGPAIRPDALAAVETPASFEASLLARLAALPAAARAAAARLAAYGRAVDPARVDAPQALAALTAAGLATRDQEGRVRLAPPALARPLLASLEIGARRALHRNVLEDPTLGPAERFRHRIGAGDPEGALNEAESTMAVTRDAHLAAEVAYIAESVDPARAAPWHERAAALEMDRGRFDAAIPHLERALALDPDAEARGTWWVWLARATLRAGRPIDVQRVVGAALKEDLGVAARSEILANESTRLRAVGEGEAAVRCARESLDLATSAGDPRVKGHASIALAGALLGRREFDEAERASKRAIQWFEEANDRVGVIRSTVNRGGIARVRLRTAEAERLLKDAVSAARHESARLALDEALSNLGVLLMESGRWKEARETDAETFRLALEDARPRNAVLAVTNLAVHDALEGAPHSALRHAKAGLVLAQRYWPEREAQAQRMLAVAYRVAGRLGAAAAAARQAIELSRDGRAPADYEWASLELARIRARKGRWSDARALTDKILAQTGSSLARAVMTTLSGRAAIRARDPESAGARLVEAERWLAEHAAPWGEAFAHQLSAELAIHEGRVDSAVASGERALTAFAILPAPPDQAEAALGFARLAMDQGSRSFPVGDWLEQASQIFERLGDHRGREQALAMLVTWQRRGSLRGPAEGIERNLIGAVSRLLQSMSDFGELTQRAMRLAVGQLGAERGVLLLTDEATGALRPIAEVGSVDAEIRNEATSYSSQVVKQVTESRGALVIGDAPTDPGSLSKSMERLGLRSIICVPVSLGGRVIGAVYMDDTRRPDVFGEDDRSLLQAFAELMAVAIENSRDAEEVRRRNEALVGENLSLRQEVGARYQLHNVLGSSEPMQRMSSQVLQVAKTDHTVLLTGENGTGKDLLARVIHHASLRRMHAFITVDCASLTEALIESVLYGHKRGSFTGADRDHQGQFQLADQGTLFLNEIGEMPLRHQAKLLNTLGTREVTPIGGKATQVDVRVIAATNRDLARMVEEGRFRIDLYHRLNVIQIEVPSLRKRKADIPELAAHFVAKLAKDQRRVTPELSDEFLAALMQSDWPGNVRELENYIVRVMALNSGDVLRPDPPPPDLVRSRTMVSTRGKKLLDVIGRLERRMVRDALERARGVQSVAARELGLTEQSMRYRLRKYGLDGRRNRRNRQYRR